MIDLVAGMATVLAWAMPPIAQSNSHGDQSHGSQDQGSHDHGGAYFDAGELGAVAKVTLRITIVAREGVGKMFFEPMDIAVKKGRDG